MAVKVEREMAGQAELATAEPVALAMVAPEMAAMQPAELAALATVASETVAKQLVALAVLATVAKPTAATSAALEMARAIRRAVPIAHQAAHPIVRATRTQ